MIETRKNALILNLVLGAIILFVAFLFWPNDNKNKQSNPIDKSKTQIEVKVKRINIRKEPSVDSEDIGDVYEGEIYTVISHVDKGKYYWYHIKTSTGIDGYIASSKKDEYVSLQSGYIDRTAPIIKSNNDFLLFVNGVVNYDSVTCEDEYTKCVLTYDNSNPDYITFKAVDMDNNLSILVIRYYNVYNMIKEMYDNNSNINSRITKTNDNGIYTIGTAFSINKSISNNNKSTSYTPIIDFYDENFKKIENVQVQYNANVDSEMCINDNNLTLKDQYLYSNLIKGNTLCINYTFDNKDNKIKYVAFGFSSDENYNNKDNYLASYYSKYYIINND